LQDFKLHLLRWHLLPKLAMLLGPLAALLGAPDYLEHYRRDLGNDMQFFGQLPSAAGLHFYHSR
jgi:hypothetical protein